jgi:hypothetical protein
VRAQILPCLILSILLNNTRARMAELLTGWGYVSLMVDSLGRRSLPAVAKLFHAFECAGQMEATLLAAENFDGGGAACHQIAVYRNMFKCHADWHSLREPDPVEGRVHIGEQIRSFATIAIFNSRFNALDVALENSRRAH